MRGVFRFAVTAFALVGTLLWIRTALVALYKQHNVAGSPVTENEKPEFAQHISPHTVAEHATQISHNIDPTLGGKESASATGKAPASASVAADSRDPFAAVLDSIIHSLEEDVSKPAHRPSSNRTIDKTIVVGKLEREDTDWIAAELSDWQSAIYTVDNPTAALHTERNKGKEANAYLTYIIENYDRLPSLIAFVHSHHKSWPQAWHTDAAEHDNVRSLNSLNLDFVLENGYANLRCQPSPGCPQEIQPTRKDSSRATEFAFGDAWRDLFNDTAGPPPVVAVACCAQFAVSRDQVLKRSRDEYLWYHNWLMRTPLDDDTSGRIFEYLYHIIMGREAVYCPPVAQCYRDVYGRDPSDHQ